MPVSNQSANTVYAGPASGGAAAPGFRALTEDDLPAAYVSATEAYARRAPFYPPFTVGANDDEFDDGSFSGWTAVQDGTGPTLTLTEGNDVLSIHHPGGDPTDDLHAYVKALTIGAGDYVEAWIRFLCGQNNAKVGILMADGSSWGAGAQVGLYLTNTNIQFTNWTNYNTIGSATNITTRPVNALDIGLRLTYQGSNNWDMHATPDGVSYYALSGTLSRTMTPTHMGFFVSSNSDNTDGVFTFRYCKCRV